MSKFIPKFRKDRDYNDDFVNYNRKKKNNFHNPAKKIANYQYDTYLSDYEVYADEDFQKSSRRKTKNY